MSPDLPVLSEAHRPRDVWRGFWLGLLVAGLVYLVALFVTLGVLYG